MDGQVQTSTEAPELGRFDWEDPLGLTRALTEEERMIAESARAYATDKLLPRVTDA